MAPTRLILCALLVTACETAPPSEPAFDGKADKTDEFAEVKKQNPDLAQCPADFAKPVPEDVEFEYIVVGSGAGGGPLASRLAEAGHKVLLLEAGDCVADKNYYIPAFHARSTEDPRLAAHYFVKHYDDAKRKDSNQKKGLDKNPQEILYPRGMTVGGSTAVNAMITVLPHEDDWTDTFGLSKAQAHAFQEKYYKRVMSWLSVQLPDSGVLLGEGGNRIKEADFKLLAAVLAVVQAFGDDDNLFGSFSLKDIFQNADQTFNVLFSKNLNDLRLKDPELDGVFSFPLANKNRVRNGARERIISAFTKTRDDNNPQSLLVVKTNALVTRVVFEPGTKKAIGIQFLDRGHIYQAHIGKKSDPTGATERTVFASKDIILSAGAYNTPQLLVQSGFQEKVGQNLQDRYEVGVVYRLEKITINRTSLFGDIPVNPFAETHFRALRNCKFDGSDDDECAQRWLEQRKGPYSSNGAVIGVLKRSQNAPRPDLHIFALPGKFPGYHVNYSKEAISDNEHLTWLVLKGYNKNHAGTVEVTSNNPWDAPSINFHSFYEGDAEALKPDMDAMIEGVEFVRQIAKHHNDMLKIDGFKLVEESPGPDIDTPEKISNWVDQEAWGHHACCTASIGNVIDKDFRVKGAENLRVVDASVFPKIPGTFIVLPTYMVSEHAADVILAGQ